MDQLDLDRLEAMVRLPSITGAEWRMYEWLLREYWIPLRNQLDVAEAGRLSIKFSKASQLLVEWTGAPEARERRTVLVVHVDREGFIVGRTTRSFDGGLEIDAVHCDARSVVEPERCNAAVQVVATRGVDEARVVGQIVRVGQTLTESDCGRGVVLALDHEAAATIQPYLGDPTAAVTAHYLIEMGSPSRLQDYAHDPSSGEVQGWTLDNALGVFVATEVLGAIVRDAGARGRGAPATAGVNVSVLYTSGEEEGFTGLLHHLKSHGHEIARSIDDVLWIVVDCSSAAHAHTFSLDQWMHRRLEPDRRSPRQSPPPRIGAGDGVLCDELACVGIRVEDKASMFDAGPGRLLFQAALARRSEGRRVHVGREGQPPPFAEIGAYVGGFCEAGVLAHLPDLLAGFGHREVGRGHVGCLAVPIRNFRSLTKLPSANDSMMEASIADEPAAPMPVWRVGPEIAHCDAIELAIDITSEACRLHMNYAYPPSTFAGYRGAEAFPPSQAPAPTRADLVARWLGRCDGAKRWPSLEKLRQWVAEVGEPMVKSPRPRKRRSRA